MILTQYAMLCFELSKELSTAFPALGLFEALTDAFIGIGAGSDVEEALIGLRVLYYRRSPALHRQYDGALTLPELFHEVAGAAAERGQRLNILGMSSMGCPCI